MKLFRGIVMTWSCNKKLTQGLDGRIQPTEAELGETWCLSQAAADWSTRISPAITFLAIPALGFQAFCLVPRQESAFCNTCKLLPMLAISIIANEPSTHTNNERSNETNNETINEGGVDVRTARLRWLIKLSNRASNRFMTWASLLRLLAGWRASRPSCFLASAAISNNSVS